ncbi:SDR family NAD(P)-dependent oxidoreductase [Nocardioides marmoribigeumensis]|jgi:NAD(P)-dependent dehydrogenase (short-subunit alcohol dehydrogenase family)|uniref:NAD(P)-dependent dehydrogenase (Short-subunit alcohol dehydrogenase family) n=1 Tax=Nocardioides marmoribigeumensis TaxID=433649 RepID=A0ABU2BXY1_9ACTN|nr:SDR family oxidoreductase [Nocardioides marmoribigeumensis]MDR7363255.1 NAD(P)-dependent dehydrogenase (short-subunit alcohol dehydrogenase family) [Nocardioides marmoribigeumensis]
MNALTDLTDLTGRTAVVTGASSGLGSRFAEVLADAGATVYAAARRLDRLEALAASPRTSGAIRPVACDVADPADCKALVARVLAETGRVDVLVNNAGASGPARVEDETEDDLERVLAINLRGPFLLAKHAGEAMCAAGSGSIVNVASILALVSAAPVGGVGYAASKGAVVAMTRELAGQWGRHGVRVNALVPGWFRTEMNDALFADETSARWVDRSTMLRRPGQVAELDGALLFLGSDASSYMTGQTLVVDGGWTAR